MKPKLLDLKELEKIEKIIYDYISSCKENGEIDINNTKDAMIKIYEKILEGVKSACEFYLDSKADPFLDDKPESIICVLDDFIRFYSHLKENEKDYIYSLINKAKEIEKRGLTNVSEIVADFNDWLFKLAFKDVLGDKK